MAVVHVDIYKSSREGATTPIYNHELLSQTAQLILDLKIKLMVDGVGIGDLTLEKLVEL